MPRRYLLTVLLTALAVTAAAYGGVMIFHESGLPFSATAVDARTAVIQPLKGIPLPSGLRPGDQIDITATPPESRLALFGFPNLPLGRTYPLVQRRDGQAVNISVTSIDLHSAAGFPLAEWMFFLSLVVTALVGLLALWRGRGRAAAGLAAWCLAYTCGYALEQVPVFGSDAGFYVLLLTILSAVIARGGFFVMVDAIARPILSAKTRVLFLAAFLLVIGVASLTRFGGLILLVTRGSAAGLLPGYFVLWWGPFLVPVLLLLVSYRLADPAQRLKLRWMLCSSAVFLGYVFLFDTAAIGFVQSVVVGLILLFAAMLGFLYTVLRHRVVDVAVVLDRTLVYGATTALVVGLLAAVNSLALRETLLPGAGLLLQVIVPLALGIVLGKLRTYMDRLVERVFFRSKYLSEKALRYFARHAGHFREVAKLLEASAEELVRDIRAPSVAIYSAGETGFSRLESCGAARFPERLGGDDGAAVALRAEHRAVDLDRVKSVLGPDGCVFPMLVLGNLRGFIVCENRPGEHYGADEKRLLGQFAREVGAAWRILRARDNEVLVVTLAKGGFPTLEAAREKAQTLTVAWAGS